jgi:hypothetical protein
MLASKAPKQVVVHHTARWLHTLTHDVSFDTSVPARAIELQALMHLPRLARPDGTVESSVATCEVDRLARQMPRGPEWLANPTAASASELDRGEISEAIVRRICEEFHYLRSHRPESRYYGAFAPGASARPVAIAVTADVDVASLAELVRPYAEPEHARVVARVFVFVGAPRNTISRLLSYVGRYEARAFGARHLLTYVNPNLGFTGTSYLASGWRLMGNESGTRYAYLDDQYVTDRELLTRFGPSDDIFLRSELGGRLKRSAMSLAPLLVFGHALRGHEHTSVEQVPPAPCCGTTDSRRHLKQPRA